MSIEEKAKQFALNAHKHQKYGLRDYSFHLEAVVDVAHRFNLDEPVIAACWLHDTMEDCGISYQELKKVCGEAVAEIVYCVTDELGRNRKERKEKTYPKIAGNNDAVRVKLCDRIANVRQSVLDLNQGLLLMYLNEHAEFRERLFAGEADMNMIAMWLELDKLMVEGGKMISVPLTT